MGYESIFGINHGWVCLSLLGAKARALGTDKAQATETGTAGDGWSVEREGGIQ